MEHTPYLVVSTRGRGHKQLTRRADVGKTRRKHMLPHGGRLLPGRRIFLSLEEFEESREVLIPGDRAGTLEVKKWVRVGGTDEKPRFDYVDVDFDEDGKEIVLLDKYKAEQDKLKAQKASIVRGRAKQALLNARALEKKAGKAQTTASRILEQLEEYDIDPEELLAEIEAELAPPEPEEPEEDEGDEDGDEGDGDEGDGDDETGDGDGDSDEGDGEEDEAEAGDGAGEDDADGESEESESDDGEAGDVDYGKLTKDELMAECEAQGVEYSKSMTKAQLIAKLQGS